MAVVALKAVTKQEKKKKNRPVINDAINVDALVSVTVNAQWRLSTQHFTHSSRVHVNRYVQAAKVGRN